MKLNELRMQKLGRYRSPVRKMSKTGMSNAEMKPLEDETSKTDMSEMYYVQD